MSSEVADDPLAFSQRRGLQVQRRGAVDVQDEEVRRIATVESHVLLVDVDLARGILDIVATASRDFRTKRDPNRLKKTRLWLAMAEEPDGS